MHDRRFPAVRRLMAEAAALFLEEYPQWMAEMGAELRRGDAAGLSFAAHRLRGAVSHFRRPGVGELTRQLEAHARAGDLTAAAHALAALDAALQRLAPDLAALARQSRPLLYANGGTAP